MANVLPWKDKHLTIRMSFQKLKLKNSSKNERPSVCNGDRMLNMRRPLPVRRDDGPLVVQNLRLVPPGVHHRLDRNNHARLPARPRSGLSMVGNPWFFVQMTTNPVTRVITDDRKAARFDKVLHRRGQI